MTRNRRYDDSNYFVDYSGSGNQHKYKLRRQTEQDCAATLRSKQHRELEESQEVAK